MKLTWFGGTTLRVHIGGRILVVDPDGAPTGIDRTELVSGADRAFSLADDLPGVDPRLWAPRKVSALIDDSGELPDVLLHRLGEGAVLIEAVGEPPLLLATGEIGPAGRWGREAVVIVAGADLPKTVLSVLNELGPRLIAVAGAESAVDQVILTVENLLDGTGLASLEPGLALEV